MALFGKKIEVRKRGRGERGRGREGRRERKRESMHCYMSFESLGLGVKIPGLPDRLGITGFHQSLLPRLDAGLVPHSNQQGWEQSAARAAEKVSAVGAGGGQEQLQRGL